MTDHSSSVSDDVATAQEAELRRVWANPKGWRYWTSVNNTQIGLWYGSAAFIFMLFAGVLALLVRLQLAVPDNDFLSADLFNQAFTLHGTVMMFLFAVPIFEAVAIFLLPSMLGARELPFPRLSAFGFWSFLIGGVFVCGSIFFGAAPNSGWFMYPPLATDQQLFRYWRRYLAARPVLHRGCLHRCRRRTHRRHLKCRRQACASTPCRCLPGTC
jgi:cytochrome c oxidase subunit I+III